MSHYVEADVRKELSAATARHAAAVLEARPQGFPVAVAPDGPPPAIQRPTGLRRIASIPTPQLTPNTPETDRPKFAIVDPTTLLVNDAYQRGLSNRSVKMIRRLVAGWDWRKFKAPVVARTAEGLEVLDGQHTAIAAACHPKIDTIPVMIVEAASLASRAAAFVGQNKERIALTPMQMHAAAAQAGDDTAAAIDRLCAEAGVRILKVMPSNGFKPGETVALSALKVLLAKRGPERARTVLDVLVAAAVAPVSSNLIKAVDALLHEEEYAEQMAPEAVTATLQRMGPDAEREANVFAAAHNVQIWRGLTVVLFRNTRKRRRSAD